MITQPDIKLKAIKQIKMSRVKIYRCTKRLIWIVQGLWQHFGATQCSQWREFVQHSKPSSQQSAPVTWKERSVHICLNTRICLSFREEIMDYTGAKLHNCFCQEKRKTLFHHNVSWRAGMWLGVQGWLFQSGHIPVSVCPYAYDSVLQRARRMNSVSPTLHFCEAMVFQS